MFPQGRVCLWAPVLAWTLAGSVGLFAEEIAGTVVDPHRRPVDRALVQVVDAAKNVVATGTTDRAGRFEINTAETQRPLVLRVTAEGFERRVVDVAELDLESLEVRLELARYGSEVVVSSTFPEMATENRVDGSHLRRNLEIDLVGVLESVPGLAAIRRGPVNLDPVVRGLSEGQVAALVDGTRTFAAGPGRMDSGLSHVSPLAAREVRVVKGPYALAWGAGSLSAIDVLMPIPEFSPDRFAFEGRFAARYGSNAESVDSWLDTRYAKANWRAYVGAGRRRGNDYEAGDGSVVAGDYESDDFRWQVGWRSENLQIDYSGGYQQQFDIDYPGRQLDATYFYTRSHRLGFSLTPSSGSALRLVEGRIYANHKDHLMNNDEKPSARAVPGRMPPFALDVDLPTESNTTGGALRFDFHAGWSWGLDFYSLEQEATRTISRRADGVVIFTDAVWPDATTEDVGSFVQWVGSRGAASYGATIRVDTVETSVDTVSAFFLANTVGALDRRDALISAAFTSSWNLDDVWQVTVGLGRAERVPSALERYASRFPSTKFQIAAEFMGDPSLDPETSFELDVGVAARGDRTTFRLDAFARRIDDYITVIPDSSLPRRLPSSLPTVYRYINGDRAVYVGAEARWTQRIAERGSLNVALEWLRADDEELGEPLFGIAPLGLDVGLSWTLLDDRLQLEATGRLIDDQDRVATSRFEQPTEGSTTFTLAGRYRVSDRLLFRAGVENLSNETYSWHLAALDPFTGGRIPERGRNVFAGLEIGF